MFDFSPKTEGSVVGRGADSHRATSDVDGKEGSASTEVPGGHQIGLVHRPKVIKENEGMEDGAAAEGRVER